MQLTIHAARRDGRYPARFYYFGGPNGFGGLSAGTSVKKLLTAAQVEATVSRLKRTDVLQNHTGQNLEQFRPVARYEVQTLMSYGWENVWTEDEKPATYATEAEAQHAIDELVGDVADAVELGHMSELADPDEYQIVEVSQ